MNTETVGSPRLTRLQLYLKSQATREAAAFRRSLSAGNERKQTQIACYEQKWPAGSAIEGLDRTTKTARPVKKVERHSSSLTIWFRVSC